MPRPRTPSTPTFAVLTAFAALFVAAGCGPTAQTAQACAPGATQRCFCTNGRPGAQSCNASGSGWELCSCSGGGSAVGDAGIAPDTWSSPPTPPPTADGAAPPRADAGAPRADSAAVPRPDAAAPPSRAPIMIAATNYTRLSSQLGGLGPFIVYAWATDPAIGGYTRQLAELGRISDPGVSKMVVFSSHRTAATKLGGGAAQLKSLGVTWLGYNTEGGMTPSSEMNALGSAVVTFARLAEQHGFDSLWGPVRFRVDATPASELAAMFKAGLDGVALQEQKFIEASCVPARVSAVQATVARVRSAGGPSAIVQVQVMPSRCLAGDAYAAKRCGGAPASTFGHCADFAKRIAPSVHSMAIWASGPQDISQLVALIRALRR